MGESIPADLSAAEALRLADRAGAAARRAQQLPRWYGPVIAAGFAVVGLAVGQAIVAEQVWLIAVLGALPGSLGGVAARIAVRRSGVVPRGSAPGLGVPVVLAVLGVSAAGLGALALARLAGGDPRWMGAAAGIAAGTAFWIAMDRLNHRVRHMRENS
ncbi:hypothetical protein [Kitasatospora sp. NPDC058190]|uniref:hypothetical protein n=1 Tax=Kitasatospora sp. NPDC058190 TaxID=3346371 RepID=UPI0036D8BCC3